MPHDYPNSARLCRRAQFARIVRHGRVCPGRECVVRVQPRTESGARLGVAAPRKYGNAVRRNRFKRLVREAFRLARDDLGVCDYMVTPRKALREPTLEGITLDLRDAHARAGKTVARGEAHDA